MAHQVIESIMHGTRQKNICHYSSVKLTSGETITETVKTRPVIWNVHELPIKTHAWEPYVKHYHVMPATKLNRKIKRLIKKYNQIPNIVHTKIRFWSNFDW